ncbi:MAG: nicotinate phosphoribosyltransferase, partial [Chloroflexi bacterium]|nr:nicotinate phosphoribosyltransferase [Chloroflexota bacterium]
SCFTEGDIAALRSLRLFDDDFLQYLACLQFTGSARAIPEASVFFANEPIIEVTAPIIEAQIVETLLLNLFNAQTMLATKAARVVHAANGRTVVDFAARRAQGIDSAVKFARSAYIAGFAGTSNVLASRRYAIPAVGTMAHSFITSFESELDAFNAYADSFPHNSTLLVDTYDTMQGVRNAVAVAKRMQWQGHALNAIRLDSGDLRALSIQARQMLDAAGLSNVKVLASGGLDEFQIDRLLRGGAEIDGFGVGTNVGTSADYPWLDCVYKLVQYDGKPTLKLSEEKETLVGAKQIFRRVDADGLYLEDTIGCVDEPAPDNAKPLLSEVMRSRKRTANSPSLHELRTRAAKELRRLPAPHKRVESPAEYPVIVSGRLEERQRRAKRRILTQWK